MKYDAIHFGPLPTDVEGTCQRDYRWHDTISGITYVIPAGARVEVDDHPDPGYYTVLCSALRRYGAAMPTDFQEREESEA